jgi:tRNA(Ile)-lysidine synthase
MKKKNSIVKKKIHNSILEKLKNKKILKTFNDFKKSLNVNYKLAFAVSGGPDSLALAFLGKCFSLINQSESKFYLVNHKLRSDSTKEARLVVSKLKIINAKCKILTWRGKKPSSNIQSIARKNRYSLLLKQCKKDKITHLVLGHQIEDLYENFLIRLLRGSGLKGLTSFGITSEYDEDKPIILRPLINQKKEDLIYISNKVFNFYVKDPSNLKERFKRVRMRNLINSLKHEGFDKKKLELTINNLKTSDLSISFFVKKNIKDNSIFIKKKNMYILNKFFFDQPSEIIFRSFSKIIKSVGKNYYFARGKSLSNIISKIKQNNINRTTLGSCFIEKVNETILISKEN